MGPLEGVQPKIRPLNPQFGILFDILGMVITVKCSPGIEFCVTHTNFWRERYVGHPIFSLCLELEQIRDHFYYTNRGHLYSKSGLGFAVTQSITKLL